MPQESIKKMRETLRLEKNAVLKKIVESLYADPENKRTKEQIWNAIYRTHRYKKSNTELPEYDGKKSQENPLVSSNNSEFNEEIVFKLAKRYSGKFKKWLAKKFPTWEREGIEDEIATVERQQLIKTMNKKHKKLQKKYDKSTQNVEHLSLFDTLTAMVVGAYPADLIPTGNTSIPQGIPKFQQIHRFL